MPRSDNIISASEVGQWAYCNRAWFLARAGKTNRNAAALSRGEAYHQRHSRGLALTLALRRLALALLLIGILLLLAVILADKVF